MGVWSWFKGVLADTGQHEPVPIYLERGEGEEGYAFRLGVRAGFGGQQVARIPVRRRPNPSPHPILKEIHECEVAGRTLEAANVFALKAKVARLLEGIAPGRTLPICYFRVPAMDYELPVYESGGMLTSPVIGGPKLKAPDLAGIRQLVCRYLVSAGYVRDVEEVMVGVVRPRDLSRVPPAAVFRSHTDPELWLPSVEGTSADGPVVGVVGHAPELRRPEGRRRAGPAIRDSAPAAPEVVGLLRYLRVELARARSAAADGLYASEVRPEIWAGAERRTEDAGTRLIAYLTDDETTRLELGVRRTGAGDLAVALEDRGINVFLGLDEDDLARQLGRHLAASDFLRFAEEVEIHAAEAPRAERLGVESIRTDGGDASAFHHDEPEEVHAAWS
ncbi:MAG TPA: hypothetical protein VE780_15290 [Thermoleophilaceae bacterium]|nr:hypothetical protein [Thermoleophilaceae bacterium]